MFKGKPKNHLSSNNSTSLVYYHPLSLYLPPCLVIWPLSWLALSASSVLAAPAEIPVVPPITVPGTSPVTVPITGPVLGDRPGGTVYSPNTLHKRDWQYPTSIKDCHVSQVSDHATTLSYTHEGQEYSEECLSHLALYVPFEKRESCRTTGTDAHGHDKECLFKKAFDEDWKFDLDKAKEAEVTYRSANSVASSDAWSKRPWLIHPPQSLVYHYDCGIGMAHTPILRGPALPTGRMTLEKLPS